MTTQFVSAAELMCRVLGMPDYRFAVIGHPVSSATDDDLEAMARAAIEQGRRLLAGHHEQLVPDALTVAAAELGVGHHGGDLAVSQ